MGKRYHFNKRGKYTGYSSNSRYNGGDWGVIIGIIIICAFLGGC